MRARAGSQLPPKTFWELRLLLLWKALRSHPPAVAPVQHLFAVRRTIFKPSQPPPPPSGRPTCRFKSIARQPCFVYLAPGPDGVDRINNIPPLHGHLDTLQVGKGAARCVLLSALHQLHIL